MVRISQLTSRSGRLFLILIIVCTALVLNPVWANSQLTVPIGHRVYDVLESAELRGIIEKLHSAKPYPVSSIIKLLEEVRSSSLTFHEAKEVEFLLSELTVDASDTDSFNGLLTTGSYHTYSDKYDIYIEMGGKAELQSTLTLNRQGEADHRVSARPFIRSDIKGFASFSMDAGVRLDQLDSRPFLDSDFTIPGEGFYMDLLAGSRGNSTKIPFDRFYAGFDLHPEIGLSFLDHMIQIRWGAMKRDWGVGTDGLQLAGKASAFEAIEGHLQLTDWFRYSFMTGSLGGFALKDGIEGNDAFFEQDLHDNEFNNNYSAKRVEVDLPGHITFGIYESSIWIKRFEIGYLNPFTILMLQQNLLGDTDNMLAGIDLQWYLPGILKAYGAAATTEMNKISPAEFFTNYRNIMGLQAGVEVAVPLGRFSTVTLQYTKLEPFFYTHYPLNQDTADQIQTSYVNKGFSLGYPLHPNSDELLLSSRFGLTETLTGFLTAVYQRRSAQYGYAIDMSVNEKYKNMENAGPKDFLGNLFEKRLSIEVGVSKRFLRFPITFHGSYRFGFASERGLDTSVDFNHIPNTAWSALRFDHVVQLGFTVYH